MAKTGGAVKKLTEKLRRQERRERYGSHDRFAILQRRDAPDRRKFEAKPLKVDCSGVAVVRCPTGEYAPPPGKGRRVLTTRTYGNFKRRGDLQVFGTWQEYARQREEVWPIIR